MAVVLAALTVFGGLMVALPRASAPITGLSLSPGIYTGTNRYVPGETINITITSNDPSPGQAYDVAVYIDNPPPPTPNRQLLKGYENVTVMIGTPVTLTYDIPAALPDGSNYWVGVGGPLWLNTVPPINGPPIRTQPFTIQAYQLRMEVNRPAYIGGDTVIVTWSANNLRGGGLAPNGYGQMWVYDTSASRTSLITPSIYAFANASGTFTFTLRDPSDPTYDGIVVAWFNDTTSNPSRFQQGNAFFNIDDLAARASVSPARTAPGGIVSASITTLVTHGQPNPPTEPGMKVDLSVWETPATGPAVEQTQYAAKGLTTDAHGLLTVVFKLDANAPLSDYEVRGVASNPSGILVRNATVARFTVAKAAGLVQVLQTDKTEYQAGDAVTVTSVVTGAGTINATLTYVFEVRDASSVGCGGGAPLLAKATLQANSYKYTIPPDFSSGAGNLCFVVTADNGQGSAVTGTASVKVVFGWLLLTADRTEFNPKDTVKVSWTLVSNRITSASYFYEVRDASGTLVTSGGTNADTSFQFVIPDPASTSYQFTVSATQSGRTVTSQLTVYQTTGFYINIVFDRSSYAPGDVMKIHYTVSARTSNSIPPPYYQLSYGLQNGGRLLVVSTKDASGDLTYTVPKGMNEGDQQFQIREARTGAGTDEVVTIRGTNPLQFVTVGDIPVITLIILIWLILMTLMMWRKGLFGGMGARAPKEAPPGPAPSEPVHAPPTSPMTVTCRSCGSPIEITTSKRPIEVMCPKCGNTEVVS